MIRKNTAGIICLTWHGLESKMVIVFFIMNILKLISSSWVVCWWSNKCACYHQILAQALTSSYLQCCNIHTVLVFLTLSCQHVLKQRIVTPLQNVVHWNRKEKIDKIVLLFSTALEQSNITFNKKIIHQIIDLIDNFKIRITYHSLSLAIVPFASSS